MLNVPSGVIMGWPRAIVDIPAGWTLCDGTNGTPDLRNRFIVGAGDTYAVDDTGGSIDHSHSVTTTPHSHVIISGTGLGAGANFDTNTATDAPPGTTNIEDNLPPFHSLAFIMKL